MTSGTGSIDAFDFTDGGRRYACRVEAPRRGQADAWWWFTVTGDDAQYAPFRAEAGDTPDSVRPRVLAYYEDRLSRRGGAPWQDRGVDAPRDGADPRRAGPEAGVAAGSA